MVKEEEVTRFKELEKKWMNDEASIEEIAELLKLSRNVIGEAFKGQSMTEKLYEVLANEMKKRKDFGEKIVESIKHEFTQIFQEIVKQVEDYPIVFKALVDKTGRITIPLAERRSEGIKPDTIVQVKMKIVGE